ncbi:MAG TPA: BatA domain-containing protein, partial [Ignavibacteriaceae bacterium]|nr:BatA domain-containing protein [Ignavibacteriaceae bacterium]
MFRNITFAYPWVLFFLLLLPVMILWYWYKGRQNQPSINFSSVNIFEGFPVTWKEKLRHLPFILRTLA